MVRIFQSKSIRLLALFLCCTGLLSAQAPKKMTSTDVYEAIKKLNFLGTALYVAAHPDDENTRMIAYLANEVKANTAYLSMTRGDGGQNLIGPEIRELLGVIRTQELLAARRIDGGNQLFSRANDFGFSKEPFETMEIWKKPEILSDVIWAIRKWQPDIIINRFSHTVDPAWRGRMHGHHTASAMLSLEAFDLTDNPSVFEDQLDYVNLWKAKRIFFNTSWWFFGSRENFEKADKSRMLSIDAGVYYPLKGKSNTEIAAESRSMHKCQGFGSTGVRGSSMEYLQLMKGEMPKDKENLFEGINTTWTRVKNGAPIGDLVQEIEAEFKIDDPAASLPKLIKAYSMIEALPDDEYWKKVKLPEIKSIIKGCLALFLEAKASDASATPGEDIMVDLELINRSAAKVHLKGIHFHPMSVDTMMTQPLNNNEAYKLSKKVSIPSDIGYTDPYWLREKWELGLYTVEDQEMRGLPETPRALNVTFDLEVEGVSISYNTDVIFKRNDPVAGEVYQPFEITPPVFANLSESVFIYSSDQPQDINVVVKAGISNLEGNLSLNIPKGWKAEPSTVPFNLKLKGAEEVITFKVYPPRDADDNYIQPVVSVGDETYSQELVTIAYDHIPQQTVLRKSEARVVKLDIKRLGNRIGYLMGAGDVIPESLEAIGYEVDLLNDQTINQSLLSQYDAIILGIRAYNTVDRLKFYQNELLEYVNQGGNLIVQYNTNRGLRVPMDEIGPYPLKISRDRVTKEEAEVRFLLPEHPVLNFPNKITSKDFDGWVQERGLYFPNEWDPQYEAVLSSNDPEESAKDGGLLIAKYGEGYYIYTGYSWFRELPAGVPGAFRIFANMISLGKDSKP